MNQNNMKNFYDIIVIGGGLVGLSSAYQLKKIYPDKRILVLEKENQVAAHQSGHNSGVIHSGIYYKPGSLKALNCISGYNNIVEFSERYDIPYEICGKLIVATDVSEISRLHDIHTRGVGNGLQGITIVEKDRIKDFEPHVSGELALWVPQTGIIDFPAVAKKLADLFQNEQGGDLMLGAKVLSIQNKDSHSVIETSVGDFEASYVVCCAGLQSDRIANFVDRANDLRIIPFKGSYYKLKAEKEYLVKNLIYPVPDPKFPFLGVHFTRMMRGGVEAGPNAVLSLSREGYKNWSFVLKDTLETFGWPGFWKIAAKYGQTGIGEIYRTLSKSAFTSALQKLIPEISENDLVEGGAGIRAQACSRKGQLVDDFDIKKIGHTIHIRNAPSPAATSCLSIGATVASEIQKLGF